MGRELASALGRWHALLDYPVPARLTAVCDVNPSVLEWFRPLPGQPFVTTRASELLARDDVDVVYVAVPHSLHEEVYLQVLAAGKDMLAEKPFGVDLPAARRIASAIGSQFVRCSSEFPFLPGAQRALREVQSGRLGRLLEVRSGFWHSSDLDPAKPANWKRQSSVCGAIGVMGDLGMHALHLPLRLGWKPNWVYAQLQKGPPERPDGKGGVAPCDTWDNALIHGSLPYPDGPIPIRFEMKRLAPGATNTWFFEALGTEGGVRFSTADPKAVHLFHRGKEQTWSRLETGHEVPFKTVTGGIFETGFPDIFLQMWASYLAERAGVLGDRFGCATVEEAVASHEVFDAALRSHLTQTVQEVGA